MRASQTLACCRWRWLYRNNGDHLTSTEGGAGTGGTREKIVFRTLGFTLSTLGSVPSNVFKVPKTTVNTFDGTESQGRKPKVRNTIFFSCVE